MVPSAGRDELVTDIEAEAEPTRGPGGPSPGTFLQIAGFSFISYDDDTAVIDLVVTKSGAYAVAPLAVSWDDGDWKLDVEPAGSLTGPAQAISSTGLHRMERRMNSGRHNRAVSLRRKPRRLGHWQLIYCWRQLDNWRLGSRFPEGRSDNALDADGVVAQAVDP